MQTSAVLPHRSTRHRLRRERRQHRQAAWIFLVASAAVFLGMLFFGFNAHSLPAARHRTLGAAYSVLVGVGIYFLARSALWRRFQYARLAQNRPLPFLGRPCYRRYLWILGNGTLANPQRRTLTPIPAEKIAQSVAG